MDEDEFDKPATRKQYTKPEYDRLLQLFTHLMNQVPKLRPDRDAWDIEGDWAATGVIHFVDAAYQPLFEPVYDFDCRSIKFVNLHRPAVRVTFYRKHRYRLIKARDMTTDMKVEQIRLYVEDLTTKARALEAKLSQLFAAGQDDARQKLQLYRQQIQAWQQILLQPGRYELAMSNYERQHLYVTANYKYRLPEGDYANQQEHLLNTQRDRLGNITQVRYNIFFIDPAEIIREHPYQNREVEGYLAAFPIKSEVGKYKLYARPLQDPADQ
ncbi:hypothetical protein [Fibrella forsythiae]|uniref:Uncharacterized protein n=1 Tax=Fibrella forsythiae TaxID=2817061 RepID=A0ABS3JT72_9BACT|nr:hypothetical protein [Fibrella forsythiae]MBO0953153.1 hypothetical protein [Fibrella forsythiae]